MERYKDEIESGFVDVGDIEDVRGVRGVEDIEN